jgi:threonylcarbamoyladenosine tRNA methylthiotransferase MtaB
MKLYHLITLGCKVNAYESEAMGEILKNHGYEYSSELKNNDLVIINTCSVTQTGDAKSRKMIRRAIANNPNAICMVVGCYSQIASEQIKDIEGVDIIIGTRNRENIYDYIEQYQKEQKQIVDVAPTRKDDKYDFLKVTSYSENTRAYLKIQDGCNNFCSYCIIPYTRGKLRSRDKEDVINEAQTLVDNNFKEIVLTGIHTAGYGDDFENYHFSDLLEEIAARVKGLKRLRISSIEASQIDDRLIRLIKEDSVVVNHLHIPLQSGCDTVLKRMNRKYNTKEYYQVITKLRELIPDIAITTDVIVGFPGETDEEFYQTVEFIKQVNFSSLHVFPFSKRSGTPASKMSKQVDEKIKTERVATLVSLSNELHAAYASKFIGQELEALFETHDKKNNKYYGLTKNYLKVGVESDVDLHNQIKKCKIISLNQDNTVNGELI